MFFRCLHIHFCGDPKSLSSIERGKAVTIFTKNTLQWFPMRIRNSSLSRLETMMERLNRQAEVNETYVPLGFIKVNLTKMDFAPCLLNYIFVRSTFTNLVRLKSNLELFAPLRFVMHPVYDKKYDRRYEVLYIPDKQMDDYKRVTAQENEKIIFLDNLNYACKPSQAVQIIEGEFAGVIGRIKRIGGVRCVVLPIGRELAPAIIDVPSKQLRYLNESEELKIEN